MKLQPASIYRLRENVILFLQFFFKTYPLVEDNLRVTIRHQEVNIFRIEMNERLYSIAWIQFCRTEWGIPIHSPVPDTQNL